MTETIASLSQRPARNLNELGFDDLYANGNGRDATFTSSISGNDVKDLPESFLEEVRELIEKAEKAFLQMGPEFDLIHGNLENAIIYRVTRMDSLDGVHWIFRKSLRRPLDLVTMGFPKVHTKALRVKGSDKGIFLVGGQPKGGKTTTASSVFVDWARTYGGINVTIEGPPELPLEGRYNKGRIYQTRVNGEDWKGSVKRALRYGSNRLFLGELREAESIHELIRMGMADATILATIHAADVKTALSSIFLYLKNDRAMIKQFAESFQGIVIHKLETRGGQKVPVIEQSLYVESNNRPAIVSAMINANMAQIDEEVERQYKVDIKPMLDKEFALASQAATKSALPVPKPERD